MQLFQPWGWILGSGVYVDDVAAEFKTQLWNAGMFIAGIVLVMVLLLVMIVRSIVRPPERPSGNGEYRQWRE